MAAVLALAEVVVAHGRQVELDRLVLLGVDGPLDLKKVNIATK